MVASAVQLAKRAFLKVLLAFAAQYVVLVNVNRDSPDKDVMAASDVWPRRLILTRVDGCKMLRNCTQPRMLWRKGGTESSGQHCQAHVEGVQGC